MRDTIGLRTAEHDVCEAFALEITVNYPVHT